MPPIEDRAEPGYECEYILVEGGIIRARLTLSPIDCPYPADTAKKVFDAELGRGAELYRKVER